MFGSCSFAQEWVQVDKSRFVVGHRFSRVEAKFLSSLGAAALLSSDDSRTHIAACLADTQRVGVWIRIRPIYLD